MVFFLKKTGMLTQVFGWAPEELSCVSESVGGQGHLTLSPLSAHKGWDRQKRELRLYQILSRPHSSLPFASFIKLFRLCFLL